MAFKLSDLFVEITGDSKPLENKLAGVHGMLRESAGRLGEVAKVLGTGALLGLGFGVVAGAEESVRHAIEESYKALKTFRGNVREADFAFGEMSDRVIEKATEMQEKFGLSKAEFIGAAADLGVFFRSQGYAAGAAEDLSSRLVELAANVKAARPHLDMGTILEGITHGLEGSNRGLRQLGILIDDNDVKLEAAKLGLAKYGAELTHSQETQARASLITKALSDYNGQLGASMEGLGAIQRSIASEFEEAWTTLGEILEPVFRGILSGVRMIATGIKDALGIAQTIFNNFGIVTEIIQVKAREMGINFVEILQWIGSTAATVGNWFGSEWLNLLSDAFTAVGTIFMNLVDNLKSAWTALLEYFRTGKFQFDWTPLLDGFKAVTAKFPDIAGPALTSLQNEIDALTAKIKAPAELEAERKRGPAGKFAGQLAQPAAKETTDRFVSLQEFSKKLQEGALGKNDAKRTADGVGQLVGLAQQANELQQKALQKKDVAVAAGPA